MALRLSLSYSADPLSRRIALFEGFEALEDLVRRDCKSQSRSVPGTPQ